jgi:hypothetical protein
VTPADISGPTFVHIPQLAVFGQIFDPVTDGRWVTRRAACVSQFASLNAVGGNALDVYLPDVGLPGHSHLLMMDKDNLKIADFIIDWLQHNLKTASR